LIPETSAGAPRVRPSRLLRALASGLFIALVVAPLVGVAVSSIWLFEPGGGVLEVEMQAKGGTASQLFWTGDLAFRGEDSSVVPLHQHPGDFERVRFPLPSRPLEYLRFDVLDGPGEAVIRHMRVLDREGRTVRTIDPMVLMPLHQIALLTPDGTGAKVVTVPAANDPMLLMRGSWVAAAPRWYSLRFVTSFSLAWIAGAVVVLIAVGVALVGRDMTAGPFHVRDALWLLALFFTVLWAKLTLLQHYPMPVPFWDQWDGEAVGLYVPFLKDGLSWRHMFGYHNEHRIFFTRVLALALLKINGQWDPQLQMVVNAGLHSLTAVVVAAVLWVAAGRRYLPIVAIVVGLAVAPPFALENTLAGFQSAFYFLTLFSVLALWLMGTHRPGTSAWFLGWFFALASLFTVAGGILTVPAIACLVVLTTFANLRDWRMALVNLIALALVAALGYAAMSPPLAHHEVLKANSWLAFKVSFARNLAFPWIDSPRASVLVWMPTVAMAAMVLIRRFRSTPLERITLALGAWVVVQAAAVAYSRGANGIPPTGRYLDMFAFGLVVNTMALLALAARGASPAAFDGRCIPAGGVAPPSNTPGILSRRALLPGRLARLAATPDFHHGLPAHNVKTRRWILAGAAGMTAWLIVAAVGVMWLSENKLDTDGRQRRRWMREYIANVRHFVDTNDLEGLLTKKGPMEIPYFSPSLLGGWLRIPVLRSILPAVIREPLPVNPQDVASEPSSAWKTTGTELTAWESYSRYGRAGRGKLESQPISCATFQHVRFELSGSTREPGLRLALHKAGSDSDILVQPGPGAAGGWRGVSVRCPDGPFTVVAVDDSETSWFAFRLPAEIGRASIMAESAIQQSNVFGIAALAFALLAIGVTFRDSRLPDRA
jgi:hypothetical protein